MNMHFRRSVTPAVYQLPMHVPVMPGWFVDRYGDIWGGMILKVLMDIRGDRMSVGGPMIDHHKHAGHDRNVWQEHLAHLLNDEFIALLTGCAAGLTRDSYVQMMAELAEQFAAATEGASPMLRRYLVVLVPAMRAWAQALRAAT